MNKNYNLSLFIFRRDLRLHDNTALLEALNTSKQVIPCFIVDPRQITSKNAYKSDRSLNFMAESLEDLQKELKKQSGKLFILYGDPVSVLKKIFKKVSVDALFVNYDYTPFSKIRDAVIKELCSEHEVAFHGYHDVLLNAPETVLKKDATPYTKFTPYFLRASQIAVAPAQKNNYANYYKKTILPEYRFENLKHNKTSFFTAGRTAALKILRTLDKFSDYEKTRDIPAINTTHLSPHNKFGTVSIREVYHAIATQLGKKHPLVRQLYWRDFFTQVAFFFPHVFGHAFQEKYNKIAWSKNKTLWQRWCDGTTGFPLVDAGMRELRETGYMHNRVRLVVASFLVKDLHIDWREGEKYFAQQLVDYDPAVNNGNWQWVASTGTDAQPYFRIFNPWLQQKKFDPACDYIKKWIPELAQVSPKIIHQWYKAWAKNKNILYPRPILDHSHEAAMAQKYYKNLSRQG